MNEVEIDLLDLLKRCLKRWKLLVVCALVGAALLNLYGVHKANTTPDDADSSASDTEQTDTPVVLTAAEYRAQLSEMAATVVEDTFDVYQSYLQQYNDYAAYCDASAYMQLDYQNVAYGTVDYLVDDHYEVENTLTDKREMRDTIIQQFVEQIKCPDTYALVANALQLSADDADISRYISAWNAENGLLKISVVAPDEETRDALMEIAKQRIAESETKTHDLCGDFDITLSQEERYAGLSTSVQDAQNGIRSNLLAARDKLNGLTSGFTDAQLNYYNALVRESAEQN